MFLRAWGNVFFKRSSENDCFFFFFFSLGPLGIVAKRTFQALPASSLCVCFTLAISPTCYRSLLGFFGSGCMWGLRPALESLKSVPRVPPECRTGVQNTPGTSGAQKAGRIAISSVCRKWGFKQMRGY